MDTFKIISVIFMICVIYQIYQINCVVFKDKMEGFEATAQDAFSQVDDLNSINTLANIAKQLLKGGAIVPGNLNIKDGVLDIKPSGDWGMGLSLTGGDKEPPYINFMNKADGKRNGYIMGGPDKFTFSNNVHINGNLTVGNTTISADGSIHNPGWTLTNNGDFVFKYAGIGVNVKAKDGSYWRMIGGCGPGCGQDNDVQFHHYNSGGGHIGNPFNIRP